MTSFKEIAHEFNELERKDECVPALVHWYLSALPHELQQSTDNEKQYQ